MRPNDFESKWSDLQARLCQIVKPQTREGGELPTFREIGRKLRLTYDQLEELALASDELAVNTAFGIPGVGYADLPRGEYTLEWVGEDKEPELP